MQHHCGSVFACFARARSSTTKRFVRSNAEQIGSARADSLWALPAFSNRLRVCYRHSVLKLTGNLPWHGSDERVANGLFRRGTGPPTCIETLPRRLFRNPFVAEDDSQRSHTVLRPKGDV